MNELESMLEIQNERPLSDEEEALVEKKRQRKAKIKKIAFIILCCFIPLWFILNILIHPLDIIKLRMMLGQNFEISMSSPESGVSYDIQIDGNVIYMNNKYYEIVDNNVYVYESRTTSGGDGSWTRWYKRLDNSIIADGDLEWLELFNKNNYTPKFGWKRFEMKEGLEFIDLHHITAKASLGGCRIIGLSTESRFPIHISIVIRKFGLINLKLPEATER